MKKKFFFYVFCLSGMIILSQCKKDPVLPADHTQQVPTISSLSPATGYPGTSVTIEGKNFGSDTNKISVTFGGIKASIVSADSNQVVVKAPLHDAGTVSVQLTVNGLKAKADTFLYAPPVYGYAPHLEGTRLTYTSHDTVSSASSNSAEDGLITIAATNVEDSSGFTAVTLLNQVSGSGGSASYTSRVWFNKDVTSFPAFRLDAFDSIVQIYSKLPNTVVTHSDGMETFTVPNQAKAGDAVSFSNTEQYAKGVTTIGGTSITNSTYWNFSNGRVLGTETITTPAGTFNCVKISYSYQYTQHETGPGIDVLLQETTTDVKWLFPGIGAVKVYETMAGSGNSPSVVNSSSLSELVTIEN